LARNGINSGSGIQNLIFARNGNGVHTIEATMNVTMEILKSRNLGARILVETLRQHCVDAARKGT